MLKQIRHSPSLQVSTHHTQSSLSHPPQVEAIMLLHNRDDGDPQKEMKLQNVAALSHTQFLSQMPTSIHKGLSQLVTLDHTILQSTIESKESFNVAIPRCHRPLMPPSIATHSLILQIRCSDPDNLSMLPSVATYSSNN